MCVGGGLRCDLLVLLDVYGISVMYVGCRVFGDVTSPVVSVASAGLKATHGRLRLLVCVVFMGGGWGMLLSCTECAGWLGVFRRRRGEYCITVFSRVFSWGPDISRLYCFVLDIAVRRGGCASCFPRCGEARVEVVFVVLVWGWRRKAWPGYPWLPSHRAHGV